MPGFTIGLQAEKVAFSRAQKLVRLQYAREHADLPMEHWQSTIFVDEKLHYCIPGKLPAVGIAGRQRADKRFRTIKDKRRQRRKWQHPKLHFMYGVHWQLGVLGPYWVHDSTGWKRAKPWKVSPPGATA